MLSENEQYQCSYINDSDLILIQEFIDNEFPTDQAMVARNLYANIKDKLTSENITEAMFCSSLSCNIRGGYIVGIKGVRRLGYKKIEREIPLQRPPVEARRSKGRKSKAAAAPVTNTVPTVMITTVNRASIDAAAKLLVEQSDRMGQAKAAATPEVPPTEALPVLGPKPPALPKTPVERPQAPPKSLAAVKKEISTYQPEQSSFPRINGKRARHVWIGEKCFTSAAYVKDLQKFAQHVLGGELSDDGNVIIDGKRWKVPNLEIMENFLTKFHYSNYMGDIPPVVTSDGDIPVEFQMNNV